MSPTLRLEVGSRLRDDYHNGHTYYPLQGAPLRLPSAVALRPEAEFLRWHNEHVFRS